MASTNKTTHYELSQYLANDKPTYMSDYNTDMSKIDAGIYSAKSEADTNTSAIGTLSSLDTSVKTDLVNAINEVKSKSDEIGNLSNLTTDANSNLVSAINEVDAHTDTNNQNIGTMVNLETTVKSSLVGAINEVNAKATSKNPGIIELFAGSVAPDGYLICDGSAISRTTYANLFSVIGTTYGNGDGSTTFNLPNLKGKFVVGLNSSESEFNVLGKTGGEKTHTLSINEMPSHAHTVTHISSILGTGGGSDPNYGLPNKSANDYTSSVGGGQAHNNLPPYITLNYIISF